MRLALYIAAWLGLMAVAIINGGLREAVLEPALGSHLARQVSTVSLLLLFTACFLLLGRLWPVAAPREAWIIGAVWLAMTLTFETVLGVIAGHSPGDMLAAYNVLAGNLWPLIPLWVLIGPRLCCLRRKDD